MVIAGLSRRRLFPSLLVSRRPSRLRARPASSLVCPVADLEGLAWFFEGQAPPAAAVLAVRQSLASASVWRVVNHGVPDDTIAGVKASGRAFFDQPAAQKQRWAVGHMDRSRGWEMYPQVRDRSCYTRSCALLAPLPRDFFYYTS